MRLTIPERLVALEVLPPEGDFITLKIVRGLRERLSFTEDELKRFEITQVDNRVSWNGSIEPDGVEVEIGEKATDIIVEALKNLDKERKLTDRHFSLYEKFAANGDG